MGTKNGIRQRRQDRIRRIMEAGRTSPEQSRPMAAQPQQPSPPRAPQPLPEVRDYPGGRAQQPADADPELLWKSQANPWEHSGWRLAPQTGKDKSAPARRQERQTVRPGGGKFILRGLFIQTVIAGALFVIAYAMFRVDNPIAHKGQAVVTAALTDKIDFGHAAAWYDHVFAGAPSFIPLFGDKGTGETRLAEGEVEIPVVTPLAGSSIVRTFAETLGGVELAGLSEQPVLAAETGRVTIVTDDKNTGNTVMVQNAGGRVTVYGGLGTVKVAVNDWVEAGQSLGELAAAKDGESSLLFFAVKEKGRYVDPADVIPFD